MPVEILIPKPVTPRRVLQSLEAPGRPNGRVAGGWISDSVSLKKFIQLCEFCQSKFNPRKSGYEVWRTHLWVGGKCDACRAMSMRCRGYIHESTHETAGDYHRHRTRGRWAPTGA